MTTIKSYDITTINRTGYTQETENSEGPYIRVDDLVKYLHEQIKISDTNRKVFEEEYKNSDGGFVTFKWQMIEAMKSESETNAFILVLQALGKNPIKETK
jgi:hypothetical protein